MHFLLRRCGTVVAGLLVLAFAKPTYAIDIETILLPILTWQRPIAGANGTLWVTEFTVYNSSNQDVPLRPCGPPGGATICPPEDFTFQARETTRNPEVGFTIAGANGRLAYLNREDTPKIFFHLAAVDFVRHVSTQLPVVRDREFATAFVELLGIPVTAGARTLLRVYDVDDRDNSAVVVRVFDSHDALIAEKVFAFTPSGYPHPNGFPSAPGYLAVPLQDFVRSTDKARVEIAPVSSPLRFWAFVTVTDNITNAIQVIAP